MQVISRTRRRVSSDDRMSGGSGQARTAFVPTEIIDGRELSSPCRKGEPSRKIRFCWNSGLLVALLLVERKGLIPFKTRSRELAGPPKRGGPNDEPPGWAFHVLKKKKSLIGMAWCAEQFSVSWVDRTAGANGDPKKKKTESPSKGFCFGMIGMSHARGGGGGGGGRCTPPSGVVGRNSTRWSPSVRKKRFCFHRGENPSTKKPHHDVRDHDIGLKCDTQEQAGASVTTPGHARRAPGKKHLGRTRDRCLGS